MRQTHPGKILIVDDEILIREMLRNYFEFEAFEVFVASNGNDAYELVNQQAFDFVITDLIMPNGNGIEFAKKLFQLKQNRPKLVIMSGCNEISKLQEKELGILKVFFKPFNPTDLIEFIKEMARNEKLETTISLRTEV